MALSRKQSFAGALHGVGGSQLPDTGPDAVGLDVAVELQPPAPTQLPGTQTLTDQEPAGLTEEWDLNCVHPWSVMWFNASHQLRPHSHLLTHHQRGGAGNHKDKREKTCGLT